MGPSLSPFGITGNGTAIARLHYVEGDAGGIFRNRAALAVFSPAGNVGFLPNPAGFWPWGVTTNNADVSGSGWVAANLNTIPVTTTARLGLWSPGGDAVDLPAPFAQTLNYPVRLMDLPHGKPVLVGGQTAIGATYVFLQDKSGAMKLDVRFLDKRIAMFAGDGSAINWTSTSKVLRTTSA